MRKKKICCRTHRRLSILPEVNEDLDISSPVAEDTSGYELLSWYRDSNWSSSSRRLSRSNTEKSTASLDSYLANCSNGKKPRQYSDSWMILDNNKGNILLTYFQTVIMENKMSLESNTSENHQGWLSPKSSSTSRRRPLQFCKSTTFYCSSTSSMDEDDKSEYSLDQSHTLVPQSSISPNSLSSPSESLPSFAVSSSSTYGTPDPSPLLSPQVSFYSCRSSLALTSPVQQEADTSHSATRSLSFRHVKEAASKETDR